ncbi:MAG: hypothetical protein BWX88_04036 [Planctomycetes bacterium ADurb.Bin126]|nr:MAG: hypothetical protein BWX88_04036 [Planctomycetes bacterium ADurb.Bin126]HOD82186.1 hypothetical protein [Phycisphaerae bacterium]HQL75840.1 hypothetical protein [Phycisphaerae bacterium]
MWDKCVILESGLAIACALAAGCASHDAAHYPGLSGTVDISRNLSDADLWPFLGNQVTIQGRPSYTNASRFVFLRGQTQTFYVVGLDEWPKGLPKGAGLRVSGRLTRQKIIADPVVSDEGAVVSNGQFGEQYVILDPRWEVVGPSHLEPKFFGKNDYFERAYVGEALRAWIGHAVTVEGAPHQHEKLGPSIMPYDIFVGGMRAWPEKALTGGTGVRVTGTLVEVRDRPWPAIGPNGEYITGGTLGPRLVIVNPKCEFFSYGADGRSSGPTGDSPP